MTYTGMFPAKQGIMVFVLSVLKRMYICVQVCPNYKQGRIKLGFKRRRKMWQNVNPISSTWVCRSLNKTFQNMWFLRSPRSQIHTADSDRVPKRLFQERDFIKFQCHYPQCKNLLNEGQFRVLKKCHGKFDCLVQEMLFIKELRPSLNTQSDFISAKLFV